MHGSAPITGLPRLAVLANRTPLPTAAMGCLTSARIHQRLGTPAQCELTFVDAPAALVEQCAVGVRLELSAGHRLFEGEVTAIELAYRSNAGTELRVRAYDVLHRLRKRQPVRAHLEVALLDLARELTADLGLTVAAEVPGAVWRHLIQHRQSDLELLVELASRSGLHLTLRGEVLHLISLEGLGPPLDLLLGENLLEATIELNADQGCSEVCASGWNLRDAEVHEGGAQQPRSVLSSSAIQWRSQPRSLVDLPAETVAHTEAHAQAELDRRAGSAVVLRGVAEGDGRLRPGTRVRLAKVAPVVTGQYVLTEVVHTLDPERGFLSRISTEPPAPRRSTTAAAASLGVVTRVDAASGRVQVRLPAHGSVETDWLQVATLGAGAGKGLTLIPDVDDVVLLLFAHEDPAQAVVVGGLYGKSGPPDAGIEGGSVKRFSLHSRSGHKITLDDAQRTLRLEDAGGSVFELAPDGVKLTSKVPLTLDAPGQPIVIRGASVDFRKG